MKLKTTFAEITNLGNRKINEDSIGVIERDGKFGAVLCDGLGGHGLGDIASKLVVDVFTRRVSVQEKNEVIITKTFEEAQAKLLEEQKKRRVPNKIKTTAVIAIADTKHLHIGHIGDSRAYIFRKNEILKRTIDHSIPQMLALSGEIKEQEIRNHPDRNMLLRVLGAEWQEPQYDMMKPISLRKVQAVLICSDGFWELIDEQSMCQCLKDSNNVQEWLNTMRTIVEINGKDHNMDNYSAIAIWNQKI